MAPYNNAIYDLSTGDCLQAGFTTQLPRRSKGVFAVSAAFQRLVAAGRKLMEVIEKNRGGTNKDLARFASQVQSLADKWDR